MLKEFKPNNNQRAIASWVQAAWSRRMPGDQKVIFIAPTRFGTATFGPATSGPVKDDDQVIVGTNTSRGFDQIIEYGDEEFTLRDGRTFWKEEAALAERCKTCRFMRVKIDRVYVCCLNPPAVMKHDDAGWPWPKVDPREDWCGSYEEKK